MQALVQLARCILAAVRTPYCLAGDDWLQLLSPTALQASPADASVPSITAAVRTLRLLSRLPRSPWRATCLYRSVAGCLAMRAAGYPAVLRVGAARAVRPAAHAWIEDVHGNLLYGSRTGWRPLGPA